MPSLKRRSERVDIVPLLHEAAGPHKDGTGSPGVDLRCSEAVLEVLGDADALLRVLRNLLDNAVKYSLPDSKPVLVSAGCAEGRVSVRVEDDGPGIPEADLGRLFEPFFRVDRSRSRKTGGYGLGLSICRRIVLAHGGSLTVANNESRGARFTVAIPAPSDSESVGGRDRCGPERAAR